jgi:pyrimidine and pyridine-specific 5'-nucleotidase
MSAARERAAVSAKNLKVTSNGSLHRHTSTSRGKDRADCNGKTGEGLRRQNGLSEANIKKVEQPRVGVLPLVDGDQAVDDGRAVVWLDIDNTLYSKGTEIHKLMTQRIRAYIIGLGLGEEEAERLHQKYYREYGLAIRGLVMHQQIDALDYDSKCDATLPLETVLSPNPEHKAMLQCLDRSKCRVWALTNAYKTVSTAGKIPLTRSCD